MQSSPRGMDRPATDPTSLSCKLARAAAAIRARFGRDAIVKGRALR